MEDVAAWHKHSFSQHRDRVNAHSTTWGLKLVLTLQLTAMFWFYFYNGQLFYRFFRRFFLLSVLLCLLLTDSPNHLKQRVLLTAAATTSEVLVKVLHEHLRVKICVHGPHPKEIVAGKNVIKSAEKVVDEPSDTITFGSVLLGNFSISVLSLAFSWPMHDDKLRSWDRITSYVDVMEASRPRNDFCCSHRMVSLNTDIDNGHQVSILRSESCRTGSEGVSFSASCSCWSGRVGARCMTGSTGLPASPLLSSWLSSARRRPLTRINRRQMGLVTLTSVPSNSNSHSVNQVHRSLRRGFLSTTHPHALLTRHP